MQIHIKERVDVNQDGPSLIIETSPPPPGPQIAKDVFHIWKTHYLLFSLLYLCLQCDEVFMTFYHLWIQHTRGNKMGPSVGPINITPGPPQH